LTSPQGVFPRRPIALLEFLDPDKKKKTFHSWRKIVAKGAARLYCRGCIDFSNRIIEKIEHWARIGGGAS
jgi:hypothetical protein